MSNENKIEIQIAATGAEQAAKELAKPAEAIADISSKLEDVSKSSEKSLIHNRFQSLLGGLGEVQKFADGIANAGKAMDAAIGEERATQLRNVAGAVSELTNGIGMVASGFAAGGPIGAAVAGVAAAGVAALKMWNEQAEAAKKAGEAADNAFQKIIDKKQEVAKTKDLEAQKNWIQSLSDEEEKYRAQNAQLDLQASALQKVNDAKRKTAEAQIDLDIKKIKNNSNLSEKEKIQQIAAKNEEKARLKAQAEIDSIQAEAEAAKKKTEESAGLVAIKEKKLQELQKGRSDLDSESRQLKAKQGASRRAANDLKEIEDPDAQTKAWDEWQLYKSDPSASDEKKEELKNKAERLYNTQQNKNELLKTKDSFSDSDRASLENMEKKKAELDAEIKKKQEELEDAKGQLSTNQSNEKVIQETAGIRQEETGKRYSIEKEGRGSDTKKQVSEAEKKAHDEKQREEDKKKREEDEKRLKEQEEANERATLAAAERVRKMTPSPSSINQPGIKYPMDKSRPLKEDPKDRKPEKKEENVEAKVLKEFNNKLSDGKTNEAELRKLGDTLAQNQSQMSQSMVSTLRQMLDNQKKMDAELKKLQQEVKTNR